MQLDKEMGHGLVVTMQYKLKNKKVKDLKNKLREVVQNCDVRVRLG